MSLRPSDCPRKFYKCYVSPFIEISIMIDFKSLAKIGRRPREYLMQYVNSSNALIFKVFFFFLKMFTEVISRGNKGANASDVLLSAGMH